MQQKRSSAPLRFSIEVMSDGPEADWLTRSAAAFFGKNHMNRESWGKLAKRHLNQREWNGQLSEGAGLLEEVTASKRRVGGGYAQVTEIANNQDREGGIEQSFDPSGIGNIDQLCIPELRADSEACLRAFRGARRPRRRRLVGLVRGRAAAIGELRLERPQKVTYIVIRETATAGRGWSCLE